MSTVGFAMIGMFLGFAFGIGCALAVMYTIFMGGYHAALRDTRSEVPPKRLVKALEHISRRAAPSSFFFRN